MASLQKTKSGPVYTAWKAASKLQMQMNDIIQNAEARGYNEAGVGSLRDLMQQDEYEREMSEILKNGKR